VEYTGRVQCKTRTLLRFCGFFEAVADGEADAFGIGKRAEDDGDAAGVELAQAGEEILGEGGVVVERVPGKDFDVAMVDRPVLRKHDADFFFVGEELNQAIVEFGLGVDEDEGGTGGVVADADTWGGEGLGFDG